VTEPHQAHGRLRPVQRPFRQVDVFGSAPFAGNPVAVVLDGAGLTTEQMQRFANWMNLSETTFVLPADAPAADYQVRIFTTATELPFAGHPTLGTCHAWLEAGGQPGSSERIVQQCQAGLIPIQRGNGRLSFEAPPLVRSGPVEESLIAGIAAQLGIDRSEILDAQWTDNGPGWVAVLLGSAQAVLDLRPTITPGTELGVVGPYPVGSECAIEVRAFFTQDLQSAEDPVTGSLNASLAQWLVATGRLAAPYVASQGTVLGRRGRVHVSADDEGAIWVGGATVTEIAGTVDL
jgi:PhzF family phenazine biosynthesis protein